MKNFSKAIEVAIGCMLVAAIAFAHAGGRDIRGTILKIEEKSVTIERTDGNRETIALVPATTYRVGNEDGRWADLRVGLRAVVHATHDGKAISIHLQSRK